MSCYRYLTDDYQARWLCRRHWTLPHHLRTSAARACLRRGQQTARHGDASQKSPPARNAMATPLTVWRPLFPGLLGLSRDYVSSQLGPGRRGSGALNRLTTQPMRARWPQGMHAVASWAAQVVPEQGKPAAEFKENCPSVVEGLPGSRAGSAR